MRPRPDAMRPRARPRPERVRPRLRPNNLASRPHGPRGHMGPEALISLPPRRLWRVDFRHLELHTFEFDACHVPPKTLFGSPACWTSAPALGHIDTQTHRPRYICSSHGSNRMGVLSQITISLFMLWYYSHAQVGLNTTPTCCR